MTTQASRVRRRPDEARRLILAAAEKRLIEGGPEAVRVQLVAADLGLTDAAVHHHFGSRRGLLEALLRYGGRRLRDAVEETLAGWDGEPSGLQRIAGLMADVYAERGYARLALWLALAGWSDRGRGMYEPLVDALHVARSRRARARGEPAPPRRDSRHAVALLNMALVAEPLFGPASLRSAGLAGGAGDQSRFRRWLLRTLEALLMAD